MLLIPEKLQKGDEIRVIAPSTSLRIISEENLKLAQEKLVSLGFNVSFGKHVYEEVDMMNSSSIESRIKDLHEAFQDNTVKAILTVIGGYNCNQLLNHIDYDIIRSNPKIFCGFSDITALQNAIYAQTGLVTYSGPHFSTFAMQKGNGYTIEYFKKMLIQDNPVLIKSSPQWSDDPWFLDQDNRTFYPNDGYWVMREGTAEGNIVGGNLGTFQLLQRPRFMPSLKDKIIFIESDSITDGKDSLEFDRDLQSLLQQPEADSIRGIVIGRFEQKFSMTREKLNYILQTKKEIRNIPVIANVDFGHTMPMITFPIGGKCKMNAKAGNVLLEISD